MYYSTTQAKLTDADRLATHYDYTNQAWVVNGVYIPCGHTKACACFGKLHAGEPVRTGVSLH